MSGGVDSSVAAALLVAQGYDVTGAFMVNYGASLSELRPTSSGNEFTERGKGDEFTGRSAAETCWTGDYQDALRVAAKLGIPLMRLDFVKEYKKTVLDYMYDEYRKGRTPNPDVLCNKFVKFGSWLDKARELGFDKLATGHYARIKLTNNQQHTTNNKRQITNKLSVVGCRLLVSKDKNKDQTYFLHQLNQKQLQHILFPIGSYTKPEVRKMAKKFALPNADKEESMGICFVGEVPMKEFLLKEIKAKKGKIILSPSASATPPAPSWKEEDVSPIVIGEHDGLPFYTIGQRQGLSRNPLLSKEGRRGGLPSIATLSAAHATATPLNLLLVRGEGDTRPLYVLSKNFDKNELVVGFDNDPLLYKKTAEVSEVNWISWQPPKLPLNCEVRLRHRQPLQKCVVYSPLGRGRGGLVIKFSKPQRAITPGQFAVFYAKGECLGGGVIK